MDTSKSLSLVETGEALARNDEPSPTRRRGAGAAEPLAHPDRQLPAIRSAGGAGEHPAPAGPHHPELLPELWHDEPCGAGGGVPGRVVARRGRAGRVVDGGRVRAWRAEHRQHQRHRRELRLRAVAVPAAVTTRSSRRRISTMAGSMPMGGSPTRCCGTWCGWRSACCRWPSKEALQAALEAFPPAFHAALDAAVLRRLGLRSAGDGAGPRAGAGVVGMPGRDQGAVRAGVLRRAGRAAASGRGVRAGAGPAGGLRAGAGAPDHPYFASERPCTMLIEEVEALWAPIAERDDWSAFAAKLADIEAMGEAYAARLICQNGGCPLHGAGPTASESRARCHPSRTTISSAPSATGPRRQRKKRSCRRSARRATVRDTPPEPVAVDEHPGRGAE